MHTCEDTDVQGLLDKWHGPSSHGTKTPCAHRNRLRLTTSTPTVDPIPCTHSVPGARWPHVYVPYRHSDGAVLTGIGLPLIQVLIPGSRALAGGQLVIWPP